LINSVQSSDLVKFLLDSGADPNTSDVQHKTALHYAVQEGRLETVKLLLAGGADPFRKSKYGDDVLQTACLKGSLVIFNFLLEKVPYRPARIADAFELMGATFLLDMHDVGSTLFFWRKAVEIRHGGRYARYRKEDLYMHPVLDAIEMDSSEDLEALSGDAGELKTQALLITERVLGSSHKDTIFRYMYAGASFADANQYGRCAALWNYALKLKVEKETLLSADTSFTARAIAQLYINVMVRLAAEDMDAADQASVRFEDVFTTASHVAGGLAEANELLAQMPKCKNQLDNFDVVLATWAHLLLVLLRSASTQSETEAAESLAAPALARLDPQSQRGESLLHLAASSSSTLKGGGLVDDDQHQLFPSPEVTCW